MALDLAGREGNPVVGVAVIAVEAVAVVVQDPQAPVVAHAAEEQLAQLGVDAPPDALQLDDVRDAGRLQHVQRGEWIEEGVRLRIGAEQDVVEQIHLHVDGEVLAHLEGRLEAEAHVRVRLRVVPAGPDVRPGEQRVSRLVRTPAQVQVVQELAPQAQVPVRLEQVDALPERFDGLAVLHARRAVLLDPGGLLLDLVLRLLQLAPHLLHHLAPEFLRIVASAREMARNGEVR